MAMTLKQAFTSWSLVPENIVFSAKSRDAVNRVLMKKWGTSDLSEITSEVAFDIFAGSTEPPELRAKAASILVQVLEWGHQNGYCDAPSFTYSIGNAVMHQEDAKEDAKENEQPQEDMKEQKRKTRVRQSKPVVQMQSDTMDIVQVWPSVSQAEKMLAIRNIGRAIENKRMAGGYFWCFQEDAADFHPTPLKIKPRKAAVQKQSTSFDENVIFPFPKFKHGDYVWAHNHQELYARRGVVFNVYKDTMTYDVAFADLSANKLWRLEEKDLTPATIPYLPKKILNSVEAILHEASDEELYKELERRGWEGELSRKQTVRLGS